MYQTCCVVSSFICCVVLLCVFCRNVFGVGIVIVAGIATIVKHGENIYIHNAIDQHNKNHGKKQIKHHRKNNKTCSKTRIKHHRTTQKKTKQNKTQKHQPNLTQQIIHLLPTYILSTYFECTCDMLLLEELTRSCN